MPDRGHEQIPKEAILTDVAYKKGVAAARENKGPWECPYSAENDLNLHSVQNWYKGYYSHIDQLGKELPKKY